MRRGSFLSAIVLLSVAQSGPAAEIVNETFGFTVTIPDGFTSVDVADQKARLHSFLDRPPTPNDPPTVITIERLNGLVDPNNRLSPDAIPQQPGVRMSLQEKTWQGITLDVMNSEFETENGLVVGYVIQFPLADEAVQLTVGGPPARRKDIEDQFDRVVDSFRNMKPLYTGQAASAGSRPGAEEALPFPWTGVAVFGAMVFVLVAIVGKWIRALFKKA
jgi:hypothetical protein